MLPIEIKQSLGVSNIQLWDAIKELEDSNEIERYFRMTPPSATICFCIAGTRKPSLSVQWGRGIKPWTPAIR
jgi:hypothetical protein